jgi:3-deoxy-manno-octulosonate cytidylyltransferase (CMP-KDO synthetase)
VLGKTEKVRGDSVMKIICVIPARYASSRFPGKPLADIEGKPMIWWVYRQALKVETFQTVYVATDDDRIASECKRLGMRFIMTANDHQTGTDRVGEVARKIEADLYINVQGDEPLITPDAIKRAIEPFYEDKRIAVTNLMTEIKRQSDLIDSTVPKVVVNSRNEAVYLSRLPVPYPKETEGLKYYKQVCVYGFTPQSLEAFSGLSKGPAERAEDIELLRFIENGIPVKMVEVEKDTIAVDTPSDLKLVKNLIRKNI